MIQRGTAATQGNAGFLGELWGFLKVNKKWWLLPILVVFLILSLLILLSSTGLPAHHLPQRLHATPVRPRQPLSRSAAESHPAIHLCGLI
jgi:hypothetical protein